MLSTIMVLCTAKHPQQINDMKNINDLLREELSNNQTPSVQYAIFDAEHLIHEFSGGHRNLNPEQPVNENTTYNLFSVSKTFTALAIMQLAQQGKLDISKPIYHYLSSQPNCPKEATIEQLLNHTAGLPNPIPLKWIHPISNHDAFNESAFFDTILQQNQPSKPGKKFAYSNLGYVWLGRLIEHVSGISYEAYVNKHIMGHAGITPDELGFAINPQKHATGYHKTFSFSYLLLGMLMNKNAYMGNTTKGWRPFNLFYNNGKAFGGIIGSRKGLIKYGQALLKPNSILLNDSLKQLMFTEHRLGSKGSGMCLSWFTGKLKGHRYVTHAGGGGGYYIELRLYPDLGIGSVLLYNRTGMTDERRLDRYDAFFISNKL